MIIVDGRPRRPWDTGVQYPRILQDAPPMTMPRRQLVDVAVTRYYHCISRRVRRAFLCGGISEHRKAWIEENKDKLHGLPLLNTIPAAEVYATEWRFE